LANVIFTSYFTKKIGFSQHDSSHKGRGGSKPDDFSLMEKWYKSVHSICEKSSDVHAVIFHNECSDKFIDKYSTKQISFHRWEKEHRPSYNDSRFYCFREFLTLNPDYDRAISTDMFDVQILHNPFEFMDKNPNYALYCGSEAKNVPGSYGRKWVNTKMRRYKYSILGPDECVYNAGCCGGNRDLLLRFYDIMVNLFKKVPPKENANMAVFNQALRTVKKTGSWRVFTGHPLHNVFESNKVTPETYIKHK